MASPIITMENASVVYKHGSNEVRALDDVSLEIYPEEYIIFFGPSGCGKSTALYAISGLQNLTKGKISVLGKDLETLSQKETVEFHRRSVGMVFQAYHLVQSLSVLSNVVLPQIFINKSPSERVKKGEEILKRFEILTQEHKYPNELSGGQQQRVAISRSLVNDPPILLADEPVGNLDSKSAEEVLKLLQELNERDKKTVILVTHNPNHLDYATRIFYMKDGKIIREVKNIQRRQVREEELKPLNAQWVNEFLKLYPNLSEDTIKAKMIVLYLLEQLDIDAQSRAEEIIQDYFHGNVKEEEVAEKIGKSFRDGGVGLYRSYAQKLTHELVAMIGTARYLKAKFQPFPRDYEEYKKILERVGGYLLLSSETHLKEEQRERFQKILKARLEGSIDRKAFQELIDKPVAEGGVGLNTRTARNMTRKLELLLVEYPITTSQKLNAPPPPPAALLPAQPLLPPPPHEELSQITANHHANT